MRSNPQTGELEHYYEELGDSSASLSSPPAEPRPVAQHPHINNRAVNPPHVKRHWSRGSGSPDPPKPKPKRTK